MAKLANEERLEALMPTNMEAIRARPAFATAMTWLDEVRVRYPENMRPDWTTGSFLQLVGLLWIALFATDILLVALAAQGFKFRLNTKGDRHHGQLAEKDSQRIPFPLGQARPQQVLRPLVRLLSKFCRLEVMAITQLLAADSVAGILCLLQGDDVPEHLRRRIAKGRQVRINNHLVHD